MLLDKNFNQEYKISMIAAVGNNRELGYKNKIPWNIPIDMRYFQARTHGKAVIMGRKTWDSLPSILKNRLNIVITSQKDMLMEYVTVVNSVTDAINVAKVWTKYNYLDNKRDENKTEIMIIGGASVYEQFLPYATRLYITHVYGEFECDVKFPEFYDMFKLDADMQQQYNNTKFSFQIWNKI